MLDAIRHGWGGGGGCKSMLDFAYMLDATPLPLHTCSMLYATDGVGGVGVRACVDFAYMLDATPLPWHTRSMLCATDGAGGWV